MLDLLRGALRSAIGAAEDVDDELARHSPMAAEEQRLHDAVAALHHAAESLERHVVVLEQLAGSLAPLSASLPPLTESVTDLTAQIGELMQVTAPLAAAEREVGRLEGFFGRRRSATTRSSAPDGDPTA